jgi:hypothetical protein
MTMRSLEALTVLLALSALHFAEAGVRKAKRPPPKRVEATKSPPSSTSPSPQTVPSAVPSVPPARRPAPPLPSPGTGAAVRNPGRQAFRLALTLTSSRVFGADVGAAIIGAMWVCMGMGCGCRCCDGQARGALWRRTVLGGFRLRRECKSDRLRVTVCRVGVNASVALTLNLEGCVRGSFEGWRVTWAGSAGVSQTNLTAYDC